MKYKRKTALLVGGVIGLILFYLQVLSVSSFSEPLASPPDCSKWNSMKSAEPLEIHFFVGALQAIDLWEGEYKNVEDHSTCTRYFFKSTGETVAQTVTRADGHSFASLLLQDHTIYTVEHAEIRWRSAKPYDEPQRRDKKLFYPIEIGILKEGAGPFAEPIRSITITVQVTAAPIKQL